MVFAACSGQTIWEKSRVWVVPLARMIYAYSILITLHSHIGTFACAINASYWFLSSSMATHLTHQTRQNACEGGESNGADSVCSIDYRILAM